MKSYPLYHVDAFTAQPFGGNSAGVVLDARGMGEPQMLQVARELRHSETAFVLPSKSADYRVRFFTPSQEVPFCGHAALAAAWVLASEGRVRRGRLRQETGAGILGLEIGRDRVWLELAPPSLADVDLRAEDVAAILGGTAIDAAAPIQKAYAGLWVLIVPLADEKAVNLCRPDFPELAALNVELGVGGTHVFAIEKDGTLYTRFFAPAVGINEDPVTGTANGALGAYLVLNQLAPGPEFKARQGEALGRPGELDVYATPKEVRIGGRALILSRGSLSF